MSEQVEPEELNCHRTNCETVDAAVKISRIVKRGNTLWYFLFFELSHGDSNLDRQNQKL